MKSHLRGKARADVHLNAALCRSAGHTPTGLSKEQLDEMVRTFNLKE